MKKGILQELPELVHAKVIDNEAAKRITEYYENKSSDSPNRLFIVFGILGALLVGTGIILLIAHNWDNFNKGLKLFFALVPLLFGQIICAYTLLTKKNIPAWKESGSVFLMLAIASSISIVSQVYNITGDLAGFLFIWMLLSLPIVYLTQSSVVSLMFISGITWYAFEICYSHFFRNSIAWFYWAFLFSVIPYYYHLFKNKPNSNFAYFHSWFLAISISIAWGMFHHPDYLVIPGYLNLFCGFILLGQLRFDETNKSINNGFLILGNVGTIILLLSLSFNWYWEEIAHITSFKGTSTFYAFILSGSTVLILLYFNWKEKLLSAINFKSFSFLFILLLLLVALRFPIISQWSVNLLIFVIGVLIIREGAISNRISMLNYGLLIITALITCRFFDTKLSFVVRGVLFIAIGAGFFFANYWMIRRRNKNTINL